MHTADKQHGQEDHNKHQRRTVVPLQEYQTDGHHGVQAEQQQCAEFVDALLYPRQVNGKGDDKDDLHQLGGLKGELE